MERLVISSTFTMKTFKTAATTCAPTMTTSANVVTTSANVMTSAPTVTITSKMHSYISNDADTNIQTKVNTHSDSHIDDTTHLASLCGLGVYQLVDFDHLSDEGRGRMTLIVRYRDLSRKLSLPHPIWQGAHLGGTPWAHATHLMFQLRQRAVDS